VMRVLMTSSKRSLNDSRGRRADTPEQSSVEERRKIV